MEDYILRLTVDDGAAVAFIATTKETVSKAVAIHNTTPVVSAALGRLITASAIMGLQLKNNTDLLTLAVKGDGPAGGLIATTGNDAMVKGYPYVNNVELPLNDKNKLDVAKAIGKGTLSVIRDLGLKEPYSGTVPLVTGEIGDDLAYYFTVSEQIPSAVGLGVLIDCDLSVKQAGGFLVQMLPQASDSLIASIEKKLVGLSSITCFYDSGKSPYELAEYLFKDNNYTITEKHPVCYHCDCSRHKVEKALISMGKKEIAQIIEEDSQATLHCHFCGKDYIFDKDDLIGIILTSEQGRT